MRTLRRRAFAWVVPIILALGLGLPIVLATETTGTFKTIGGSGGFSGGTVAGATTFSSSVTFSGQTLAKAGSVASPSYSFSGDPDTGFYDSVSNNSITVSLGGVNAFLFNDSAGIRNKSTLYYSWSGGDPLATGADAGFRRVAANVVAVTSGETITSGWLQQWAGDVALNANYTNATAAFTNTNLTQGQALVAGSTYTFDLVLFFDDSIAADGAQFDFNGGSAAATNFRAHCIADNATGGSLVLTNGATTTLATAVQVALALTTQTMLECHGTFVPSGAGTFIVRAAQTAHTTGTLTVDRGSSLNIRNVNPL